MQLPQMAQVSPVSFSDALYTRARKLQELMKQVPLETSPIRKEGTDRIVGPTPGVLGTLQQFDLFDVLPRCIASGEFASSGLFPNAFEFDMPETLPACWDSHFRLLQRTMQHTKNPPRGLDGAQLPYWAAPNPDYEAGIVWSIDCAREVFRKESDQPNPDAEPLYLQIARQAQEVGDLLEQTLYPRENTPGGGVTLLMRLGMQTIVRCMVQGVYAQYGLVPLAVTPQFMPPDDWVAKLVKFEDLLRGSANSTPDFIRARLWASSHVRDSMRDCLSSPRYERTRAPTKKPGSPAMR